MKTRTEEKLGYNAGALRDALEETKNGQSLLKKALGDSGDYTLESAKAHGMTSKTAGAIPSKEYKSVGLPFEDWLYEIAKRGPTINVVSVYKSNGTSSPELTFSFEWDDELSIKEVLKLALSQYEKGFEEGREAGLTMARETAKKAWKTIVGD